MNREKKAQLRAKAAKMIEEGMPREQIMEDTGFSYGYLTMIAREHGLAPKKVWVRKKPYKKANPIGSSERNARAEAMAFMFKSGSTLEEIGVHFDGISRERVRQILKTVGVVGSDGGRIVKSERERDFRRARREAKSLAKHGCDLNSYKMLVELGATRAWHTQRNNANHRGIPWEINLWQWWKVWEASGKWEKRGRKKGQFVMARFGDAGPYSASNVEIITCTRNILDMQDRRRENKTPLSPRSEIGETE